MSMHIAKQITEVWLNRQQPGIKKDKQVKTNDNLDESLKKGPRLCWVWNNGGNRWLDIVTRKLVMHNWARYIAESGAMFEHAELISREEIEKYLGDS